MLNRLRNDSPRFDRFSLSSNSPARFHHHHVLIKLSSVAFFGNSRTLVSYLSTFSRRLLISGKNRADINENFAKEFRPRFLSRFKPARILVGNRFHPSFDTFDITETLQIGARFFFSYDFSSFFINFLLIFCRIGLAIKHRIFLFQVSNFFYYLSNDVRLEDGMHNI